MPLYIRRLPAKISKLFDKKTSNIPENHSLFNPSISYPIIYIRGVKKENLAFNSYIILHNIENNKLNIINNDYDFVEKNINLFAGIEDLRLCHWNDKLWFTATCTHASKQMNNELLLGYFNKDNTKIEQLKIVDIGILPVKNICPFVYNDNLLLLDIHLKCIYRLSIIQNEDKKEEFIVTKILNLVEGEGINIDKFKGSSSPIHITGTIWGCIIHDTIFNLQENITNQLSYIHYWMEFDLSNGSITFLSSPFWVAHWGIEWCGGCHYDKDKDNIQLYFGLNDQDCFVAETTLWNIRVGK